jgi:hypothetical protein
MMKLDINTPPVNFAAQFLKDLKSFHNNEYSKSCH